MAAAEPLPHTIRIARLSLDYHELPFSLERLELVDQGAGRLALSVDRIDGPLGTLPLWASARLKQVGEGWDATGVIASGPGDVVLRFNGTGLATANASLELEAEPIRFTQTGLQLAAFWPQLGDLMQDVRGTLGLEAAWQGGPDGAQSLKLAIADLRFSTDYGRVGPVDGTIELDRLLPPRTAEPQSLSIQGIGLRNLVKRLEIEALGAEGTIDGDIRFSFTEEGRLFIDEGRLVARGPGVLRYRPDQPPAALAGQGQGVELLLTALADFRFEALSAMVRGYLDDDLTVDLELRGANPDLYEGHPIELNVNLEAPIVPLVGAGRDALQLPEAIRRAIEAGDG